MSAGRPEALRIAFSSGRAFSRIAYTPSLRVNVPKLRGCGRSASGIFALPSLAVATHGNFIASRMSSSFMLNTTTRAPPFSSISSAISAAGRFSAAAISSRLLPTQSRRAE